MKQIKPCPFCGSENLSVGGFENYIKCKNCGAAGPDGSTLNEAFDKWNAAPRKEDVEMEKNCGSCKYNQDGYCSAVPPYKSFRVNDDLCCTDWEAKGPEPAPLNTEDSSGKPFINGAKEELIGIRIREPFFNVIQQLAEEAAELSQAALKYGRTKGMGSYTKVNPKDARDFMIEEFADVLLCMEAAFPHCSESTDFYSKLERTYCEKAKRWLKRLKAHEE